MLLNATVDEIIRLRVFRAQEGKIKKGKILELQIYFTE